MRARLTPRRLHWLAARFAPAPAAPRVFWLTVANPDVGRAFVDAAFAAMQATVWDELAPLAMRGEILAAADLFDAGTGRVEAAGRWWRLALAGGTAGVVATVVERGGRPWLARG